ncbi:MAG: alpha/beta fold hydrolase, partial [Bacteroidota bacterium]
VTPTYARHALFSAGFLWQGVPGRSASMQAPALAVNGGLDLVSPVSNAFWLTNLLPFTRLHLFPQSGHLCNWEHPEEFNQTVASFLTEPG